jgi:hypothetical protein
MPRWLATPRIFGLLKDRGPSMQAISVGLTLAATHVHSASRQKARRSALRERARTWRRITCSVYRLGPGGVGRHTQDRRAHTPSYRIFGGGDIEHSQFAQGRVTRCKSPRSGLTLLARRCTSPRPHHARWAGLRVCSRLANDFAQQCHAADRRKRACGDPRRFAPRRRLMASVGRREAVCCVANRGTVQIDFGGSAWVRCNHVWRWLKQGVDYEGAVSEDWEFSRDSLCLGSEIKWTRPT